MAFFSSILGHSDPQHPLMPVFLSQSSNLQGRILLHCTGTVQDSMLREKIALRMGFGILKKLKKNGNSVVKSIHSEDPKASEGEISAIIGGGKWRLIRPGEEISLQDFQRYLTERLSPVLKDGDKSWDKKMEARYAELYQRLMDSRVMKCSEHESMPELPGIYVFFHDRMP